MDRTSATSDAGDKTISVSLKQTTTSNNDVTTQFPVTQTSSSPSSSGDILSSYFTDATTSSFKTLSTENYDSRTSRTFSSETKSTVTSERFTSKTELSVTSESLSRDTTTSVGKTGVSSTLNDNTIPFTGDGHKFSSIGYTSVGTSNGCGDDVTTAVTGQANHTGKDIGLGLWIGVAVGLVVVLIVVIVIVVWILRKRRHNIRRSNTRRVRKVSKPEGVAVVERRMIQHPTHIKSDSIISAQAKDFYQEVSSLVGDFQLGRLPSFKQVDERKGLTTVMETKLNNNKPNEKVGENSKSSPQIDGTKPKTINNSSKEEEEDIIQTYLQHKNVGYSQTRKLSGPNNKVPTNLLSDWKNKYGRQQEVMMEEEEEEEEEENS